MKEISNATTVQPTLDLAILTLLNISNDLFEFEKNLKELEKSVESMVNRSINKIQTKDLLGNKSK